AERRRYIGGPVFAQRIVQCPQRQAEEKDRRDPGRGAARVLQPSASLHFAERSHRSAWISQALCRLASRLPGSGILSCCREPMRTAPCVPGSGGQPFKEWRKNGLRRITHESFGFVRTNQ